ncbi:zeta toxin family protein [Stenotrophomonas lactitubi]|uniref:zeta toxin family protein n=1 Tax=Stenotrophomonas lactitubi TaxID=2045214 RepID=UPI00203FBFC7|nr:zeta toxin family protein [Stenotrophomonas lactitubi]
MSTPDGQLDPAIHAKTFQEKVLPRSRLHDLSSHESPTAIILGGQPGSGKGSLVAIANQELNEDAVVVDPDELRKYHPDIEELRERYPTSWSSHTHGDASAWADELLDATVSGKKNLIFDTTLSNGEWSSELIKDLQSKGYAVEVRAVATPKLESELGVDKRFTDSVDRNGYGRYVPAGARDAIYDKLPGSLDAIHERTDVQIRIFNRDGKELYDSHTSPKSPGVALQEARDARLKDLGITRQLRDGWQEQKTWNQDLERNLSTNDNVNPTARGNLLTARYSGEVVESLERNAQQSVETHASGVRSTRIRAGGALGIAALALDAYDAGEALRNNSRLRGEGNDTAAESGLIHFGARSVGGFAGAGLGMAVGAVAGVESGPGLLVTGAVGGIAGAFAGDKIAEWTDNRRIYNQADSLGNTWTYNPDHPDQGWQRPAPVDSSDDRIDNPMRGLLRAPPALANQLNYQATSESVKLVLGSPPSQHDPFTQPANISDPQSWYPAQWTRTADGQQWQREVTTAVYELGQRETRIDVASPERAAELDQAAAQVVLHNAANSRPAIAARYEAAYTQNGWASYGSIPEAVQQARTDLDALTASDDNRYQRQADGRWVSDGVIYDSSATGNLRAELDATRDVVAATLPPPQAIQRPSPMTADGRMRDTLQGAYANAGVAASAEQLAASAAAVQATQAAEGLDPDTTALQVQRNANGDYDVDSPIANLRLASDGKTYTIAAVTTTEDIHRAQKRDSPDSNNRPQQTVRSSLDQPVNPPQVESATPSRQEATPSTAMAAMRADPLYRQIRDGVAELDTQHGREFDATSERMTASLLVLAKNSGLTQVDHVVLSNATSVHPAAHNVFVVQGKLDDPAHLLAAMPTEQAVKAPIEESMQKYEVVSRQVEQQSQTTQLQEQHQQENQAKATSMGR